MPNINNYPNTAGIIIAGGKGKRMKTDIPKPLILLQKKPIIWYSLQLLNKLNIKNKFISISSKDKKYFERIIPKIDKKARCIQDKTPKKGNAAGLISVLPLLPPNIKHILVIHPDSSCFIKKNTILLPLKNHLKNNLMASFSIKQKNISKAVKATENKEFEPGSASLFIFKKTWLKKVLPKLKIDPETNEYRIEYLFKQARKENSKNISFFPIPANEYININSLKDLKKAKILTDKNRSYKDV